MKSSITTKLAFLTILSCLLFSNTWAANENTKTDNSFKEEILTALEKRYSRKSFEADFTQISRLEALERNDMASGHAFFSHPGKMRWQYLSPEQHEIITNGKSLWIYRPSIKQVMTGDAKSFFPAGAGGAFLSDISLVRKNFTIHLKTNTPNYVELSLVANKKISDISSILIRISKKNTQIERVTTYNIYDDTTIFEFSNIQFNPINPGVFEFIPPSDASIIEMN